MMTLTKRLVLVELPVLSCAVYVTEYSPGTEVSTGLTVTTGTLALSPASKAVAPPSA